MSHHLQISLVGNEIACEGLKQLMADRGFRAKNWPLNQLNLCVAALPDAPDQLVVVDVHDSKAGLAVCKSIRQRLFEIRIMLLHDADLRNPREKAEAVGIDHLVERSAKLSSLWEILDHIAGRAAKRRPAFQPVVVRDDAAEPSRLLSMREIEILVCLATGQPNKLIARRLNISEATVKAHVKTMLRKLSLANRTQAAIWALQHRLISFDSLSALAAPFPKARLTG